MTQAMIRILALLVFLLNGAAAHAVRATDLPQRAALVEKIIATAEAAVANPRFVTGSEWERFKQTIRDPALWALGDDEFQRAFNEATEALPFSHFRLHGPPAENASETPSVIKLEWPRAQVALVRLREFSGSPARMTETLNRVIDRQPDALIIDLRGTPGGSFPTALALSRAIRKESIDAGVFLTRRWFVEHGHYPDANQYEAIPPLEVLDLDAFAEQLRRDGAARLVLPGHDEPVFEGRIILLTDGDTASTSEPFVYLMQQDGVPVIGERTAGKMLSAEHMPMNETFRLFVPVADYVTPDLVRLDGRGVRPDFEVPASLALERALQLIDESSASPARIDSALLDKPRAEAPPDRPKPDITRKPVHHEL